MSNSDKVPQKSDIAKREEEILEFWQENRIFQKSVKKDSPKGEFVFYDGPPFATGLPHYGHILPGTMKDVIPRFKSMQGYRVPRRWGWDCHGLPLENQVEDHLGIKDKQEIEERGIDVFNETAKKFVLQYADDWKEIIPRSGRWIDMEDDYRTMDPSYTESIWWAFKRLHDKGLAFEGFKPMHICPRCETPLSNFEVNQGYSDIKDIAVTVKFQLVDEDNTYLLAWTTTPWTLPGNMALAVNPDLTYSQVKVANDTYIIAKERVEEVMEAAETEYYEVVGDRQGEELIGLSYQPPFPYFEEADLDGKGNAWQVYAGDFVTLEEGTGIVHMAPAFGSDDMKLAREHDIPVVHHVNLEGKFIEEVEDFAGEPVKPRDDTVEHSAGHLVTDIKILRYLQEHGTFFSKENITHSYPLCWRCDTPLLNYAMDSWFIEVTKVKDKLVEENKKIHWVPEAIGSNRFGEWLEGARDWAISRLRYWGAPLPVWKSESGETQVIGSLKELKQKVASNNTFHIMRHGEADHNVSSMVAFSADTESHVTEKGKKQAVEAAKDLPRIDVIVASPFERTKETAKIVADHFDINGAEIVYDERLVDIAPGEFEGRPLEEWKEFMGSIKESFTNKPKGGDSFEDVRLRVAEALFDINQQYDGKSILVVTHGAVTYVTNLIEQGLGKTCDEEQLLQFEELGTGEWREVDFWPYPHNSQYELDFHRPYIDEVTWENEAGEVMRRIPDIFDCWFESGSMPFASNHYPFEKDNFDPKKDQWFPADFIAEGLDQTRGWFYSLLVLGVTLFDESPYKNVIVNGLILAEDGKKMSKRLKNYPEINYIFDKYGADALRFYLLNSPAVRAESFRFSEEGVDEVVKKVILRLSNVISFLEMYVGEENLENFDKGERVDSEHVLDKWIQARLDQLSSQVTESLENYELDKATRPFLGFIDDLSTWYLRRSRNRFRGEDGKDKKQATQTLLHVLNQTAKLLAPFMPFTAEDVYQRIGGEMESVHLENWPITGAEVAQDLMDIMKDVREIVSQALDKRSEAEIKVRQPLSTLRVQGSKSAIGKDEQLLQLIIDEVNIKEVTFADNIDELVVLNTEITPKLKEEGQLRELIRSIQKARKQAGAEVGEHRELIVETDQAGEKFISDYETDIKEAATLSKISFTEEAGGNEVRVGEVDFYLEIK